MTAPRLLTTLLVSGLLLTGCVSMPDRGKVTNVDDTSAVRAGNPADINPAPPQAGESATDIVVHFLDAMAASPIDTSVARQFLTADAAASWDPEREIIAYAEKSVPFGSSPLSVRLVDAVHLDSRGVWQGELPREERTLRFPVTTEDGEWRISSAPNALVVSKSWFEQRFQRMELYFFDPTGRVLIPEQVFLPRGDQQLTALVRGLLQGPPEGLAGVERSFVPAEASAGLSVPVSGNGVATIPLEGESARLTPEATPLLLAQLAWTLRQVPGLRAFRVSLNGDELTVPGKGGRFGLELGAEYDPTGLQSSTQPFGLRDGLLATGPVEDMRPVDGPFGTQPYGLRSIAVSPVGTRVAGVSGDGRALLVGSLHDTGTGLRRPMSRAADLLTPSWDLSGRLWLLDRRPGGALVSVAIGRRAPQVVVVPGVTGERVRAFQVSRDGSRFVAVVERRGGDVLLVSRIAISAKGALSCTPARVIPWPTGTPVRVRDLGWRSPTSVRVLSALTEELSEVTTVSLDGSPGGEPSVAVPGRLQWLVGSPAENETLYVTSARGILAPPDRQRLRPRGLLLSSLTYAG